MYRHKPRVDADVNGYDGDVAAAGQPREFTFVTVHQHITQLDEARNACHDRDWLKSYELYVSAQAEGPLAVSDLDRLADAAWWLGKVDESVAALEESHRLYLQDDQPRAAATSALNIAYTLSLRGETALASGWMGRSARLLEREPACAEQGYIKYYEFESALSVCDDETALARARTVREIGLTFGDPTLTALGVMAEGRVMIRQGLVSRGMELLDEAMLSALTDDLHPGWGGNIYCHLMSTCQELSDIRRAAEWTDAISHWWSRFSATGPFLGICRAYRAQVFQVQGAWDAAEHEATQVCARMAKFAISSVAEAHYQLGELARLRGDLTAAEAAYREAHHYGRDPQPGYALLRLAQGRPDLAQSSIQAAISARTRDRLGRARLCSAQIEIALAMGNLDTAREAEAHLAETARTFQTSGLTAASLSARGSILLAEGNATDALPALRSACLWWQELSAPFETARLRMLLARAYRLLADHDAAAREEESARASFAALGVPISSPEHNQESANGARADGLTNREIDILQQVAVGKTNRSIGDDLFISQKTVARHLANIFAKLDLSSRTAAAAYAIEQGLTAPDYGSNGP